MMKSPDRRQDERFDVVGAMWGVLEINEPAQIENVSLTGALLNSSMPAAPNFEQAVQLVVDGQEVKVDVTIRHVHAVKNTDGEDRYLIGVECASPPMLVVQAVEQLAVDQGQDPARS